MKIFTKMVKVLGVTHSESIALRTLVLEAGAKGKAEMQIGPKEYLSVEVDDVYASCHPESTQPTNKSR